MLLEVTKTELIIRSKDGSINALPRTPYFELKYLKFNGERIIFTLGKYTITETYDDMIFNVAFVVDRTINTVDIIEKVIQMRSVFADVICKSYMTDDVLSIDHIVDTHQNGATPREAIMSILSKYGDRIKETQMGFIIDNLFLVDTNGTAYELKNNKTICIVASTAQSKHEMILSKILFLLKPNLNDLIFTTQLKPSTLETLKRDQGIDTRRKNAKKRF